METFAFLTLTATVIVTNIGLIWVAQRIARLENIIGSGLAHGLRSSGCRQSDGLGAADGHSSPDPEVQQVSRGYPGSGLQ